VLGVGVRALACFGIQRGLETAMHRWLHCSVRGEVESYAPGSIKSWSTAVLFLGEERAGCAVFRGMRVLAF